MASAPPAIDVQGVEEVEEEELVAQAEDQTDLSPLQLVKDVKSIVASRFGGGDSSQAPGGGGKQRSGAMMTTYEEDVTDRIAQMSAANGVAHVAAKKGPMTPAEKEWHFVMCSREDKGVARMKQFLDENPRHTITLDNGTSVDMPFIDYRSRINGFTALHYAAQYSDIKTTSFLLSKGANPNIKSFSGLTPLHVIAQAKMSSDNLPKKNVVAFYLLGGMSKSTGSGINASPHIRDHHGRRPVDLLPPEHAHLKELFAGHVDNIQQTAESTNDPGGTHVKRRGAGGKKDKERSGTLFGLVGFGGSNGKENGSHTASSTLPHLRPGDDKLLRSYKNVEDASSDAAVPPSAAYLVNRRASAMAGGAGVPAAALMAPRRFSTVGASPLVTGTGRRNTLSGGSESAAAVSGQEDLGGSSDGGNVQELNVTPRLLAPAGARVPQVARSRSIRNSFMNIRPRARSPNAAAAQRPRVNTVANHPIPENPES